MNTNFGIGKFNSKQLIDELWKRFSFDALEFQIYKIAIKIKLVIAI